MAEIGLGCWALGSDSYGFVSEKDAESLIQSSIENGISFFDTAPIYGDGLSEMRLGKYLPDNGDFKIATKVGIVSDKGGIIKKGLTPELIINSIENSLKRLNRSSIYMLQLHSPELGFENEELLICLDNLKQSGQVQKIGISLKSPMDFEKQIRVFPWDGVQFNCSMIDQRIQKFSFDLIALQKRGVDLIARTPLNFGFLSQDPPVIDELTASHHLKNWPSGQLAHWLELREEVLSIVKPFGFSILQSALRYPIDSHLATIVIPGAKNAEQLLQNIQAFKTPIPYELLTLIESKLSNMPKVHSPYQVLNQTN